MEEEKEKKVNKPLIIFLVVFLLIILGGSIFFIYQMVFVGSDDNFLNVYKMNDGTICLVSEASDSCSELAFQIETENSDAKLVAVDSNNLFVLLDDNGLKLYNIEAKEITAVSLEDTYSDYAIYLNNDQDKVIGIVYTNSTGKVGYYNVSLNQKLYDDKYNNISQIDDNYLNASFDTKNYLLNANEEIEELVYEHIDENDQGVYYQALSHEDKYYFFEYANESRNVNKIYANDKEVVSETSLPNYFVSFYEGNLYIVDSNTVKKYDIDANLLSTSDTYNDIKELINNNLIYVNDNKLSLVNIDSNENINILDWRDTYSYDANISRYYTKAELDSMGETDKEEGIYLVIRYSEPDENGNNGVIYCYTNNQELKTYDLKTD